MSTMPQRSSLVRLKSFTGLIPLAISLPLLLWQLWTLSIVVSFVSALLVIGYHLQQGQGITSFDILSIGFAIVNAVLFFGFHSTIVFDYLDTIIYALLFVQVLIGQLRGEPWTIQYAKRSVPQELWTTRRFYLTNRFLSLIWGGCFLICLLISLWKSLGTAHIVIPALLVISTAILTPRLAAWYRTTLAA